MKKETEPEPKRGKGRPKKYATVAERQKAYRERLKANGFRVVSKVVKDTRNESQPLTDDVVDLSGENSQNKE